MLRNRRGNSLEAKPVNVTIKKELNMPVKRQTNHANLNMNITEELKSNDLIRDKRMFLQSIKSSKKPNKSIFQAVGNNNYKIFKNEVALNNMATNKYSRKSRQLPDSFQTKLLQNKTMYHKTQIGRNHPPRLGNGANLYSSVENKGK